VHELDHARAEEIGAAHHTNGCSRCSGPNSVPWGISPDPALVELGSNTFVQRSARYGRSDEIGSGISKLAPSDIRLKRAYESPQASDGLRILVDRLWPRGVSKKSTGLDAWMKELGPTSELRMWFGHKPDRWAGFAEEYRHELATPLRQLLLSVIHGIAEKSTITLIYGARDAKENEAVVLRHFLLHERAQPDSTWDAADKLLVTAASAATVHHDSVASASALKLFAAPILTPRDLDDALKYLLTGSQLRESSDGWKITARGRRRLRQLSST
jgi:uncharacterized protein YeaO (DUF488 family)